MNVIQLLKYNQVLLYSDSIDISQKGHKVLINHFACMFKTWTLCVIDVFEQRQKVITKNTITKNSRERNTAIEV